MAAVLVCVGEANALARKLSFREAVELAIEQSPALAAVRQETAAKGFEYQNSYSVFLPQLDLTASQGLQRTNPSLSNSSFVSEFGVQLTENLYDNGASLTKYESARLQKEIADLKFKNERDRLVLQLADEYLKYSLSAQLKEVQEQQFTIVNKQYRSVENSYQQGVKTRRDYLRFKTELRRSEIELESSRSTVERSRLELTRLLGVDVDSNGVRYEFQPLDVVVASVAQIPMKAPALSDHAVYRIAELQKQVFEKDVDLVRRRLWPEVFVNGSAFFRRGDYLGNTSSSAGTTGDSTGWNAFLTLKFNILDWGIRRRDIAIADVRRQAGESGLSVDLQSFSSDSAKVMVGLQQNKKNFELARELLDLETSSYGFLDSEYRNGRVTYLDIIVGLRDLLSAKVQMYTSYFDLKSQLLQYRYREGKLYETVFEN